MKILIIVLTILTALLLLAAVYLRQIYGKKFALTANKSGKVQRLETFLFRAFQVVFIVTLIVFAVFAISNGNPEIFENIFR